MRNLARRLFAQDAAVLLLTTMALACLPFALRPAARDAALSLLVPVSLIGALGGYLVYRPRLCGTRAATAFLTLGAAALFIRVSQSGDALWNVLLHTGRVLVLTAFPLQPPAANLQEIAGWLTSQEKLWSEWWELARRSTIWLVDLARGTAGDDPASRALWLGLGIWLLTAWASQRIWLSDDVLGGLLPTGVLVALTLDLSGENRWSLWLFISVWLLLLALVNLARLQRSWFTRHTDYSDSIATDSLTSATAISIIVLVAAFSASTFSIKDLIDQWREHQQPTVNSSAGSSSGSGAAGRITSGVNSGLQNTHIITGGPVLSDDVVMLIRTGDLPSFTDTQNIQVPRYYWRGATYQSYTGRGWNNPMASVLSVEPEAPFAALPDTGHRTVNGVVTFPGGAAGMAYWTGALVHADVPLEVVWRPAASATAVPAGSELLGADLIGAQFESEPVGTSQTYSFESWLPLPTEADLRTAPPTYPAWVRDRYLQLPDSVPDRVRALARDITVHANTPYDRALAIERYLRNIP